MRGGGCLCVDVRSLNVHVRAQEYRNFSMGTLSTFVILLLLLSY